MDARLAERLGAGGGSGILGLRGPARGFAAAGLVSAGLVSTALGRLGGYPRDRLRSALAGGVGGFGTGGTGVGSTGIGAGSLAEFLDRLLPMGRGVYIGMEATCACPPGGGGGGPLLEDVTTVSVCFFRMYSTICAIDIPIWRANCARSTF